METLTLSSEQAREIVYQEDEEWTGVENQIIENSRWSIIKEGVFKRASDGTFWKISWSEGATEEQEEMPFEYAKEVTFTRVEKREVTVERWVEV